MSDQPKEPHPPDDEGERPPLVSMLILVAFPFVLVVVFGLLYVLFRR